MIPVVAVLLVTLHGPDKQAIWINPSEVVSIRKPRDEHFDPDVQCVLQTADGKLIAVEDDCEVARKLVGATGGFR